MKHRLKLGVNIDHVATLRQARMEGVPNLLSATRLAIQGGADSIVAHLREDRRHIQDNDIYDIRKLKTHFDLEMAATSEMIGIALRVRPDMVTLVPEKRRELTTEGGLDVVLNLGKLENAAKKLEKAGIRVSLFIDPKVAQIKAAASTGASFIEIHTGKFALSNSRKDLKDIIEAAKLAKRLGLSVNAGHGLNYANAGMFTSIGEVEELNIGFSIIARSIFTGLKQAVSDMKRLIVLFLAIGTLSVSSYAITEEVSSTPEVTFRPTTEVFIFETTPEAAATAEIVTAVTEETRTIAATQETPIMITTPEAVITQEIVPITTPEVIITPEVLEIFRQEQVFVDVPSDHWAATSVNKLVKMGVTQGYPDGTFRGSNYLSRYETAVFLSKMAHKKENRTAENEKIMEELKSEVHKIRYSLDLYKRQPGVKRPFSGSFSARLRLGNIVSANSASSIISAPMGPVFDYRLITYYKHEFSEVSYVRFGIDTMDSTLVGGRDLAREMFEAEAAVESKNGLGVSITSGPGIIIHKEGTSNIFPSDDYKVYLRPNNGIKLFYEPDVLISGIGYSAASIDNFGKSETNDVYAYVGYKFRNTVLGDLAVKYSAHSFTNDLKARFSTAESTINMYEFTLVPGSQLEMGVKFGVSASQNTPHNVYTGIHLISRELLRKGSTFKLYANKVGSEFMDYPTYPGILGLNISDKLYQAGTNDFGCVISQTVTNGYAFSMISNIVTGPNGQYGKDEPRSNATFELDMDMGLSDNAIMTIAYRTYQSPAALANATSDMLGLGFRYLF